MTQARETGCPPDDRVANRHEATVSSARSSSRAIGRARAIGPTVPILVAASLLKLWLTQGQVLTVLAYAQHDDYLYTRLGYAILQGRWLGPYDNLTLAKGPFYPLWLALNGWSGLSLLLTEQLLYLVACAAFALAVRPLLPRRWHAAATYLLLLFNPASWGFWHVTREGIYPALALLTIAGSIGLYTRRAAALWSAALWATFSGLALAALWLTREDGAWILPALLILEGATVGALLLRRPPSLLPRLALCLVPPLLLGAGIVAISAINARQYGVAVTVEVQGTTFTNAYDALTRVDPAHAQPYALVPRRTREQVYAVSPAFRELQPHLEGDLGATWLEYSCYPPYPITCQEFSGDIFMWVLRDAAARRGYYQSAPEAAAYFARLAAEVNAACRAGRLACGPPTPVSLLPPLRWSYLPATLRFLGRGLVLVVRFDHITPWAFPSDDAPERLPLFRAITHDRFAPPTAAPGPGFAASPDRVRVLALLTTAYRAALPPLALAAIAAYIALVLRARRGEDVALCVCASACLVAALSRVLLVALVEATAFHALFSQYLAAAHPLLLGWLALVVPVWWGGGTRLLARAPRRDRRGV